ncbi:hypothetical protein K503DRAFT_767659 [Rhizopogon vinicolor AM-OR11-026]|uniref:Uncharacterized protein n=1 Tax=Rhizopogon vinicolor AM-OR11-026 TaxID=1314800 RepID=A0A1B7N9A3_9AGAM|nr:hypothetical protein K503DRAFT_767659 [Rhizopogon vinicolor AM-OR11-026]
MRDVYFFMRTSLDKIRMGRSKVFGQPPKPWPSDDEFKMLACLYRDGHVYHWPSSRAEAGSLPS